MPIKGDFDDESCRGAYGLVYRHITDENTYPDEAESLRLEHRLLARGLRDARVAIHADMIEVTVRRGEGHQVGGGIRNKVYGLSAGSRRRLMKKFCKVRELDASWFVHLTYPDEFPEDDWETWKRDLKVFIQRLLYQCAAWGVPAAGVWRLEVKIRKTGEWGAGKPAPHYHIMLLGLDGVVGLATFQQWLSQTWWEVVGSGDPDHLRAGTKAERMRSRRGTMAYLSEYVAKKDEEVAVLFALKKLQTGRVWGQFGELDCSPSMIVYLPATALPAFRRTVSAWLRSQTVRVCAACGGRARGKRCQRCRADLTAPGAVRVIRSQAAVRHARRVKRGQYGFFALGLGDEGPRPPPGGGYTDIERMLGDAFDQGTVFEHRLRKRRADPVQADARRRRVRREPQPVTKREAEVESDVLAEGWGEGGVWEDPEWRAYWRIERV
jgi:hypothetical protein